MNQKQIKHEFVWVFQGENANFPSAVFSEQQIAMTWIEQNQFTGILTGYPINIGVYDWAVKNSYFQPKHPHQQTANFKTKFSTAFLPHFHFVDGVQMV